MKSMFLMSGSVALILNLMEVYLAAASRVIAEQSVQVALETQKSQTEMKLPSSLSEMEMRSNESQTQRWDTMGAHQTQLDAESFYDLCVMDRKRGRDCMLWSDPNRGWKSLKTGSLLFMTEPTWLSFAVRAGTSKSVSHSAMIAWFKWDETKGYMDIVAEYHEDAILGLVEVTSGMYQDIQSGANASGFQTHTFYGKMLQEAVGTQIFIKPRKKTMNEHQLTVLRTLTSCMHARRPDYVHKDVVNGVLKFWNKDAIIYRWRLMVAKTTTEADEDYERMVCSQMTALIVMEFDGPLQEVSGGGLHKAPSIQLSSEVDEPGCALLPGDFDPGDLKHMILPTYGPVYELQVPWLYYPEYQALFDQQKAVLAAHPLGRSWSSFARECKAGIDHLDYVRDYTPLWRRMMLSWLQDVNETFDGVLSFHDVTDHELYEIMSSPTGLDELKNKLMCVRPPKHRKHAATVD